MLLIVAGSVSLTDFFFFFFFLISPNLLVSAQCRGSQNAWGEIFFFVPLTSCPYGEVMSTIYSRIVWGIFFKGLG